ncbi:MAG: hypothetical protein ACYTE5_05250 [Planctomycetota bacterium]|jgi:hypothetical protein
MITILLSLIVLSSIGFFLLLMILRPKLPSAGVWESFLKMKTRGILLEAVFALGLISLLFLQSNVSFSVALRIALIVEGLLISLILLRLICGRAGVFVSFARVKIRYVLSVLVLVSILILCTLLVEIIGFVLAVIVASASVNLIALQLTARFRGDKLGILESDHVLHAIFSGSIVCFLAWVGIVKVITEIDIAHIMRNLKNSDKLQIWNYSPQFSGGAPWRYEDIIVTDSEAIMRIYNVLDTCKYKMEYVPGSPLTKNRIGVRMYKGEKQIGDFAVISTTLQVGSDFHRYRPSDKQFLNRLRAAMRVNDKD